MLLQASEWWMRLSEEEQCVLIEMLYEMADFADFGVEVVDEKYVCVLD